MRLGDLINVGLWPGDLEDTFLQAAHDRLADASRSRLGYAGLSADRAALVRAQTYFDQNAGGITNLLGLAINLARDSSVDVATVLQRIQHQVDFNAVAADVRDNPSASSSWLKGEPTSTLSWLGLGGAVLDPRQWTTWIGEYRNAVHARARRSVNTGEAWERRARGLHRLFALLDAPQHDGTIFYDDLIIAVSRIMPLALLPPQVKAITEIPVSSWSLLALGSLNRASGTAAAVSDPGAEGVPGWLAVASLYALGFNAKLVAAVAAPIVQTVPRLPIGSLSPSDGLVAALPTLASFAASQGILVITAQATIAGYARATTSAEAAGQPPVFVVHPDHLAQYDTALRRLTELGAFQGTINEHTA